MDHANISYVNKRRNKMYIIEHHFTYGWDILNEENVYSSQTEAQEDLKDFIEESNEDIEHFRVRRIK